MHDLKIRLFVTFYIKVLNEFTQPEVPYFEINLSKKFLNYALDFNWS